MSVMGKTLHILALLTLAACTAQTKETVVTPTQTASAIPSPMPPTVKPGEFSASIPAIRSNRYSRQNSQLIPLDPASQQALPDYAPISLDLWYTYAFSPDQQTLAVVGFNSDEPPRGGRLHLIHLKNWEEQAYDLGLDAYVSTMAFSPDGAQLAVAYDDGRGASRVLLFDLAQAAIGSQNSADFVIHNMKFTTDGRGLMLYGAKDENDGNEATPYPPIVTLLNSRDLSVRWTTDLKNVRQGIVPKDENSNKPVDPFQPDQAIYLYPALVFAPDQDILYVLHADEDQLTTVDFETRKVSTVEIRPQLSWVEQLLSLTAGVAHAKVAEGTDKRAVVSPDGQFLYVVGQRSDLIQDEHGEWQIMTNPLGLQIIRAADGSRVGHYDTPATNLSISPDGRYLYLKNWSDGPDSARTEVFDAAINEIVASLDNVWLLPTRRVNGASILASSILISKIGQYGQDEYRNTLIEPQGLSVVAEWNDPDNLTWLTTP